MKLDRYRDLVDDWPAFTEAIRRPLPDCVWTNTLRVTPARLQAWVADEGVTLEPLGWHPAAFRFPEGARPSHSSAIAAGLMHIQEEVSMIPPVVLGAEPGERILDSCAAPGNKTVQLAVALNNTGTVVANDVSYKRLRPLRTAIERLGILNISFARGDASNLPRREGAYDRILCDVPCSAEGTTRKNPEILENESKLTYEKLGGVQKAILWKAFCLLRPGGRIVYSTCTFAPEENEAVIDAILERVGDPGKLRVLPAPLPGFRSAPGVTEWAGQQFDPSLKNAMRVWPHLNDSGGFFVCLLEKPATAPATPEAPPVLAETLELTSPQAWRDLLVARYGLPREMAEALVYFETGGRSLSCAPSDHVPPVPAIRESVGSPLFRTHSRFPKPTTTGTRALGAHFTRHVVSVDRDEALTYLSRGRFPVTADRLTRCETPGFILVEHDGIPLGTGHLHGQPSEGGEIESLLPKVSALRSNSG